MKLFVTGGAGFVGSNFIHHVLTRSTHAVVNYDKLTYAGNLANLADVADDIRYRFVRGDICDDRSVEEAMTGCDGVVHLAAESHVDRSIYDPGPAMETNLQGTFVLLKIARRLNVRRFVHVSTDEVYGNLAPGQTAHEASPLQPSSPYSASKAGSDLLVRAFIHTYGFPAIITRATNNYGPYQFPEKFVPLMICNALEGKPLPVYGDGRQEREWLHVEDHCRALLLVLEHGQDGEIYNVGGGDVLTNVELLRRIRDLLGKPEPLVNFVADRPGHDRRCAVDSAKLRKELGWEPRVVLEEGLRRTVDWYRDHTDWVHGVGYGDYMKYYDEFYVNRDAALRAISAPPKGS